jgi:hypothetical protein
MAQNVYRVTAYQLVNEIQQLQVFENPDREPKTVEEYFNKYKKKCVRKFANT